MVVLVCFEEFDCLSGKEQWVFRLEDYTHGPLTLCEGYLRCGGRVRCGYVCRDAGDVVGGFCVVGHGWSVG